MWMFWISTLLLVAIAVVFVIIPFIQKRANNDQALRDELNKAFYKDRLKELEEETEEGIVADQQDLIADLKQTLLDDIPTQQKHQQENRVSLWMVLAFSVVGGRIELCAVRQVWSLSACSGLAASVSTTA